MYLSSLKNVSYTLIVYYVLLSSTVSDKLFPSPSSSDSFLCDGVGCLSLDLIAHRKNFPFTC